MFRIVSLYYAKSVFLIALLVLTAKRYESNLCHAKSFMCKKWEIVAALFR